ncbi:MAG: phenylalanine--tRNA ligase subunit beta [Gammaproteobacteria bacterium]
MKFHYQHLIGLLKKIPSKTELSEILFQLGHENEMDGEIFDLELTPNRGDCLSLLGLARDLNFFFGHKDNFRIYDGQLKKFDFNFINHEPDACPEINFLYLEIENEVNSYRDYLQSYFQDLSNKKVNFFTDISNYVSYELGQPTHCYDFTSLQGALELKKVEQKKDFITLQDEKIVIDKDDLVFSVNDEVINLAGIMGGKSTRCSDKTTKVLLECAHFRPDEILGKSTKYGLSSDASHKYERFVDSALQDLAIKRFIKIVEDHAEIKEIKLYKNSNNNDSERIINLDFSKINSILGTSLDDKKIIQILNNLSFEMKDNKVRVPSFRNDIFNTNDIAEEVARIIGYNNISSQKIDLPKTKKDFSLSNYLRNFLTKNGFTEVINFQFTNKNENQSISIDNPLDQNKSRIRTSVKDSLLENLLFNERRQKSSIKLFEISDIYSIDSSGDIHIKKVLGLIASGRVANNYKDFSRKIDTQFIDSIFKDLSVDLSKYLFNIDRQLLDTKRKEEIVFLEIPLGKFEGTFNVKDIEQLDKNVNFYKYKEISDFPSSTRDFSFMVSNLDTINQISKKIFDFDSKILKDAFLFDFYENASKQEVKAAYRFIFQDFSKTLTDEAINQELEPLLSEILKLKNVSIPGYKNDIN